MPTVELELSHDSQVLCFEHHRVQMKIEADANVLPEASVKFNFVGF